MNHCMDGNTIVLLPTGTGKTLIAFTVILNNLQQLKGKYPEVAKKSVFLAPTRVLVDQQQEEFKKHCKDPDIKSVRLHGDYGVELLSVQEWEEYFKNFQVFFFTPQVFSGMSCGLFLPFICFLTMDFIFSGQTFLLVTWLVSIKST